MTEFVAQARTVMHEQRGVWRRGEIRGVILVGRTAIAIGLRRHLLGESDQRVRTAHNMQRATNGQDLNEHGEVCGDAVDARACGVNECRGTGARA